jgi:hypothetical protein
MIITEAVTSKNRIGEQWTQKIKKDVVANFMYCSGTCLEELHNIHENKARKARLQRTCLGCITGSVRDITINSISRSIRTSSSNVALRHTHTEIYSIYIHINLYI